MHLLNTEGGTMIFGVRPDGQIEPISKAEDKGARQIEQFLHAALSHRTGPSASTPHARRRRDHRSAVGKGPAIRLQRFDLIRRSNTSADAETIRRLVHQHYTSRLDGNVCRQPDWR